MSNWYVRTAAPPYPHVCKCLPRHAIMCRGPCILSLRWLRGPSSGGGALQLLPSVTVSALSLEFVTFSVRLYNYRVRDSTYCRSVCGIESRESREKCRGWHHTFRIAYTLHVHSCTVDGGTALGENPERK